MAGGADRLAARALELAEAGDLRLAGHLAELAAQADADLDGRPGGARRRERAPRRHRGLDDGARGVLVGGGRVAPRAGRGRRVSAARIAAACVAAALVALAAYRIRTGRGGRAALGLLGATLLTLYAADATSALPGRRERRRGRRRRARRLDLPVHGRDGVPRDRDPARDPGVPRRMGRDARRRDGGRGADRDRLAGRPGLGLLGSRGLGHRSASAAASGVPSCSRRAGASASPSHGWRSSTRGSTTTARPRCAWGGWSPWRGPSDRSSRARRTFPTAASWPGTWSARCCSRSSSAASGTCSTAPTTTSPRP